jgi:lipoyl-dependent peroxiredoxin
MKRTATAIWQGGGKDGKGHLTTQSTVLDKVQYSYTSRFEQGIGTNPEELIAAAHSGCFTMKLSFNLGAAGFTPDQLETRCEINFENGEVTESHLILKATVKGIDQEKFAELVKHAEENCPISKILKTKIYVDFTLNS